MNHTSQAPQRMQRRLPLLLTILGSLSCSQQALLPAWSGEDQSTRFIYCVLDRDEAPRKFDARLSRITSIDGSLAAITASRHPDEHLEIVVYSGRSFASSVQLRERVAMSKSDYEDLISGITSTGIITEMPDVHSHVEDGTWMGFEYKSGNATSLGYANNDAEVLDAIAQEISARCGKRCDRAFHLADSTDVPHTLGGPPEHCVAFLSGEDLRGYL